MASFQVNVKKLMREPEDKHYMSLRNFNFLRPQRGWTRRDVVRQIGHLTIIPNKRFKINGKVDQYGNYSMYTDPKWISKMHHYGWSVTVA